VQNFGKHCIHFRINFVVLIFALAACTQHLPHVPPYVTPFLPFLYMSRKFEKHPPGLPPSLWHGISSPRTAAELS